MDSRGDWGLYSDGDVRSCKTFHLLSSKCHEQSICQVGFYNKLSAFRLEVSEPFSRSGSWDLKKSCQSPPVCERSRYQSLFLQYLTINHREIIFISSALVQLPEVPPQYTVPCCCANGSVVQDLVIHPHAWSRLDASDSSRKWSANPSWFMWPTLVESQDVHNKDAEKKTPWN